MSRFRLPPRVAPSPAAGEPGLQNAAARLRSSREAQARILEERRSMEASGEENAVGRDGDESMPSNHALIPAAETLRDRAVGPGADQITLDLPETKMKRPGKEKLVVLFRLPLVTTTKISKIRGAVELGEAYVLKALAKEGRAGLRALRTQSDLSTWTPSAKEFRATSSATLTVGESMTVYLQPDVLSAMHDTLGDPWKVLPKATVAGAYLAAIVTHLVEARLAE